MGQQPGDLLGNVVRMATPLKAQLVPPQEIRLIGKRSPKPLMITPGSYGGERNPRGGVHNEHPQNLLALASLGLSLGREARWEM